MKNLANCTPKEFLVQTNKIRKSVERWLEVTDIMNIRGEAQAPKFEPLPKGASAEEVEEHMKAYRQEVAKASSKSMNKMLEAIMEKHPDETVELLALLCFVDPKDANNYTVTEYLKTLNELLSNETVIDFFTSLVRLGQSGIFKR